MKKDERTNHNRLLNSSSLRKDAIFSFEKNEVLEAHSLSLLPKTPRAASSIPGECTKTFAATGFEQFILRTLTLELLQSR